METRTNYEEEGLQEEFTESIAKQYNRRSKMATKRKPAAPSAAPKNGVKASKINKQTMVDAIVNLEEQMQSLMKSFLLTDDALRQYITWKEDANEFQEHMNKLLLERVEMEKEAKEKTNPSEILLPDELNQESK